MSAPGGGSSRAVRSARLPGFGGSSRGVTSCCARPCEAPGGPGHVSAAPSSLGFPFEGPASSDLDFPGGQRLWRARSLGEEAVAFLPASASIGNKDEAQCPSRPAGWCPCLSLFPGPGRGGQFLSVHTPGPYLVESPLPRCRPVLQEADHHPPTRLSTPVVPGSGPSLITAPTTWFWLP